MQFCAVYGNFSESALRWLRRSVFAFHWWVKPNLKIRNCFRSMTVISRFQTFSHPGKLTWKAPRPDICTCTPLSGQLTWTASRSGTGTYIPRDRQSWLRSFETIHAHSFDTTLLRTSVKLSWSWIISYIHVLQILHSRVLSEFRHLPSGRRLRSKLPPIKVTRFFCETFL